MGACVSRVWWCVASSSARSWRWRRRAGHPDRGEVAGRGGELRGVRPGLFVAPKPSVPAAESVLSIKGQDTGAIGSAAFVAEKYCSSSTSVRWRVRELERARMTASLRNTRSRAFPTGEAAADGGGGACPFVGVPAFQEELVQLAAVLNSDHTWGRSCVVTSGCECTHGKTKFQC